MDIICRGLYINKLRGRRSQAPMLKNMNIILFYGTRTWTRNFAMDRRYAWNSLCAALTTGREVHRPFTSSQSVCVVGRPQRICVVWLQVTTRDVNMAKFLRPRPRPIFFWSQTGLVLSSLVTTTIRLRFDGCSTGRSTAYQRSLLT